MTLSGHIQNGSVVLDQPTALPDGTAVRIEVVEPPCAPTLYERLKPIVGVIDDLPEDLAENHDHYIHGTPKK